MEISHDDADCWILAVYTFRRPRVLSDTYYFGEGLPHDAVLTYRVTMLGIGAWALINDVNMLMTSHH